MGCVNSRPTRLTEVEDGVGAPVDSIERWTRMLTSRLVSIDFRDADNRTFYEESDFVAECVGLHNLFRHRHRAPPLRLCTTLCHSAQSWANRLAHTGYLYHRNLPDIGENIYCRRNYLQEDVDLTGKEVIDCWYRGSVRYNYDLEPNVLHVNAGAFTQMVWIGTREVGLGKARSRDGRYVAVANYRPAGNMPGQFHDNVTGPVIRCVDDHVPSRSVLFRRQHLHTQHHQHRNTDGSWRRSYAVCGRRLPYTFRLPSRMFNPVVAVDRT